MDKRTIVNHRGFMPDHSFNFVADIPTVFHCHHFNLFWDQTIDDALGPELGTAIRTNAARESFYDLMAGLAHRLRVSGPEDMLTLAQSVLHLSGLGSLAIDADPHGGEVVGEHLHHGTTWNSKYGRVQRHHPADAVTAGFAAAAIELAYGSARNAVRCREVECVAVDAPRCVFVVESAEPGPLAGPMTRSQVTSTADGRLRGLLEGEITPILATLRQMTANLVGDERGRIDAFGLAMSELPATYYNRAGYEGLRHVSRTAPASIPVMHALLREAGHVGIFHTFGAIMASPEWDALVGRPSGDRTETLASCVAIARALGMGHWTIAEFEPGQRLVLQTPATYEATYYVNREGRATEPQCFCYQGAAIGVMQLIERVDWHTRPSFDQKQYARLFDDGLAWKCTETQCVARGDPYCEVVVSRRNPSSSFI